MAAATLINTLGTGLYAGGCMLFFTRSLGMSVQTVGACLTLAAAIAVPCGVPIGHLGDRLGLRRMFIALQLAQAICMAALPFTHGIVVFCAVLCGATVGQRGAVVVGSALIAHVGGPARRTHTRAYLRSVSNLGTSLGLLSSVVALIANTRRSYDVLIFADAISFVLAAVLLVRLRDHQKMAPRTKLRGTAALRDRPYLTVAALSGVLSFQFDVIAIAMPLWVVQDTRIPRWMVAVLMFLNGAVVVCCQVWAARRVVDLTSASRSARRAGLIFFASMCAFAAAAGAPSAVAVGLLIAAVLTHSAGEISFAAGTFELGYRLAHDHGQGQYQGVFNLAAGGVRTASPFVLAQLCLTWGRPGWIVLGAVFAATGLAMPPVAEWAEGCRRSVHPVEGTLELTNAENPGNANAKSVPLSGLRTNATHSR